MLMSLSSARRSRQKSATPSAIAWPDHRPLIALMAAGSVFALAPGAHADPLASPSLSGPLSANAAPVSVDAGPLGKVYVSGQLSALGLTQTHATQAPGSGDASTLVDLSNAQIEVQTTSGPVQFYVQAGDYAMPSLGSPYLASTKAPNDLYGAVPVAYAKFVVTPELSVQAGALPTLIGAESTFTFQNMNIERGLLWNQEPASSRGVQVNYAKGPVTLAVSLNDGYYSNRYNWVSGSLAYAFNSANTLTLIGGGNLGHTATSSVATPLAQNNSSIFNVIYTYSAGPLTVTPYVQYSRVEQNLALGIDRSAETAGGAVLAKYTLTHEFSLAARAEYNQSSGGSCDAAPDCSSTNLLYGPGSRAWSLTLTPTYQKGVFFARAEVSYTRVGRLSAGSGFGSELDQPDQVRGVVETGVLF